LNVNNEFMWIIPVRKTFLVDDRITSPKNGRPHDLEPFEQC
jgi:hypothetical protein